MSEQPPIPLDHQMTITYHHDATFGMTRPPHPGSFASCLEPNCVAWRKRWLKEIPDVE
jgi:hypothetical protein